MSPRPLALSCLDRRGAIQCAMLWCFDGFFKWRDFCAGLGSDLIRPLTPGNGNLYGQEPLLS